MRPYYLYYLKIFSFLCSRKTKTVFIQFMKQHLFLLLFLLCVSGNCPAQTGQTETREKWRIGVAAGPGYLYASSKKAEDELVNNGIDRSKAKSYYRKYKWGWQGNTDVHYLINAYLGVGAKYAFFSSSARLNDVFWGNYNGDGLHLFWGDIKEQLYVNYVGPSVFAQAFADRNNRWKTTALVSFGYTDYRTEAYIMNVPMLMTGHTFGAYSEIGMEYHLSKYMAIGVNLTSFASAFKKLTVKTAESTQTVKLSREERENVSRLDLSFAFRVYL